ncbi:hypothetical protein [Swaminathania salitolerans]|uniref:Uncharacterized protein n=1 Tax=Swaminathania salitolerans TaxID=182838 RepID=A0A511BLX4_9PROT|nr:hypothetical protein [Swaminathania salitolerans]GBQ09713.1 hypothetical protein AA21291_0170 [Swaminathania salitolerans LMG 21291]GEL00873.1 hypothetical protein SSA02_00360 [Swaminathania salitolerans]
MTASSRAWETRVLVEGRPGGEIFVSWFRLECSRYERCDTASIGVLVRDTAALSALLGEQEPAKRPDIVLQIREERLTGGQWQTVFHGMVDRISRGSSPSAYVLNCRDYLALLLERRLVGGWSNATGIELVRHAVEASGLGFDDSALSGMEVGQYSGQFWQIEHRRLSTITQNRHQTAFDLVFSVAREQDFECSVQGRTVMLHPWASAQTRSANVFSPDAVTLRAMHRDLSLSGGAVVGVQSWDSRQRARSAVYYDGSSFMAEPPSGDRPFYCFRAPGRRMDDIRRLAQGKHRRIMAHAFEARLAFPAMVGLAPRHLIRFDDGMTKGGKVLSVDSVRHVFDGRQGYLQDVTIRDRSG